MVGRGKGFEVERGWERGGGCVVGKEKGFVLKDQSVSYDICETG